MRDFSESKNQQTHNRMSAMHESTYQKDVKNKTYPGEQEPCQEHDDDGSPSHKRSPDPYHKYGHDDWDLHKDNEQEGHEKIKMIAFAMEGEEGHC
jgi:hypothetical protein